MTATASPDINPDTLAARILAQAADALIYAGRDGRIERWNAAAQRVFGFSAAEAIGQSLDLIIPEHLRAGHWRGWDAAMQTAQLKLNGQATLTRALTKAGDKCFVEMSFALVMDDAGTPIGAVAMARDVTARVAKERAAPA
jgi:PAS domain S-box-containing protein